MSGIAPERRVSPEAARANARPEGPLGGIVDVSGELER